MENELCHSVSSLLYNYLSEYCNLTSIICKLRYNERFGSRAAILFSESNEMFLGYFDTVNVNFDDRNKQVSG